MTTEAPLGEVRFTLPPFDTSGRRGQPAREVRHASIPQQVWAKRVELSDGKP